MQVYIFAVLPQLDGMPPVRLLETREADIRQAKFFGSEKTLERLTETISQHLHSGRWHMFTATTLESCRQIVLRWERTSFSILRLDGLQHLGVELAALAQALHQQLGLYLIRIEAILKRSHADILLHVIRLVEYCAPAGGLAGMP